MLVRFPRADDGHHRPRRERRSLNVPGIGLALATLARSYRYWLPQSSAQPRQKGCPRPALVRDSSKLSRAPSLLAARPAAAKTSATDGGPPSNTGRHPRRRVARDADGRRGEVPQALREL